MKTTKRFVLFFFFVISFFSFSDVKAEEFYSEEATCVYNVTGIFKKPPKDGTFSEGFFGGILGSQKQYDEIVEVEVKRYSDHFSIGPSSSSGSAVLDSLWDEKAFTDSNGKLTCPTQLYLSTAVHNTKRREYVVGNDRRIVTGDFTKLFSAYYEKWNENALSYTGFLDGDKSSINRKPVDADLIDKIEQDKIQDKLQCDEIKDEHISFLREVNQTLKNYKTNFSDYIANIKRLQNMNVNVKNNTRNAMNLYSEAVQYSNSVKDRVSEIRVSYPKGCAAFGELDEVQSLLDYFSNEKNEEFYFLDNYIEQHPNSVDNADMMAEIKDQMRDIRSNLSVSIDRETVGCDFIDSEIWEEIRWVLTIVQVAVPILILVLGSVDFGKAVLADDQDALKKATSKFVKRCIIGVAIFLVPIFLEILLNLVELPEVQGSLCKNNIGL